MTPLETEANPNIRVGPLRWGRPAREIFYDLREAKALIEDWRIHSNTYRPHSSLGYKPPAPVIVLPASFIPPFTARAA